MKVVKPEIHVSQLEDLLAEGNYHVFENTQLNGTMLRYMYSGLTASILDFRLPLT